MPHLDTQVEVKSQQLVEPYLCEINYLPQGEKVWVVKGNTRYRFARPESHAS